MGKMNSLQIEIMERLTRGDSALNISTSLKIPLTWVEGVEEDMRIMESDQRQYEQDAADRDAIFYGDM
jgi:hypothetical protein